MVLLSSERQNRKARARKQQPSLVIDPGETADEANKMNLLQLCGRFCISAVFLYYGGKMMHERVKSISLGDENLFRCNSNLSPNPTLNPTPPPNPHPNQKPSPNPDPYLQPDPNPHLVSAAFEGVLMVFLMLLTGFLVAGMKSRW